MVKNETKKTHLFRHFVIINYLSDGENLKKEVDQKPYRHNLYILIWFNFAVVLPLAVVPV